MSNERFTQGTKEEYTHVRITFKDNSSLIYQKATFEMMYPTDFDRETYLTGTISYEYLNEIKK